MIDAQDWEGCPNKTECIEGNRFGKGCVEDAVQSAMGGKPWHECRCGVDCNGNPPNARQAAENEKLRAALEEVRVLVFGANRSEARYPLARAALEEKP